MDEFEVFLNELYEYRAFREALISDEVEKFFYYYLIMEHHFPSGKSTREFAQELYNKAQPYIATMKLFGGIPK